MGDILSSPLRGRGHRGRQEEAQGASGGTELGLRPDRGAAWGGTQAPGLTTGRVEGAALGGRHPEVGGACVKDAKNHKNSFKGKNIHYSIFNIINWK